MKNKYLWGGFLVVVLLVPVITKAISEDANYSADFGECYPDPVYESSFVGKTLVAAKLRSVACMNGSNVQAILPANSKVKVLAKTDGWYKIKTTDGKVGWMGSWIIAKTSDTSFTESQKETSVKITKEVKTEAVKKIASFGTAVSQMQSLELSELYSLKEKVMARIAELEKKEILKKDDLYKEELRKKEELLKKEEQKKEALKKLETATTNTNGKIALHVETVGSKVKLNWQLTDMVSSQGFKVVVAEYENPVYPGNDYHYLADSSVRVDEWSLTPGTYFFRVCEYLGGKCGVYSNNVKVVVAE